MSLASVPTLLYHSSNPTLYPTNVSGESLLAIRFPSVVRVSSIRLIPQGVRSFSSEQGVTHPSSWTGQLFFNISGSNPVNALSSTTVKYNEGKHALDYPIHMPEGVTTRLIMLRSPATALTISIYGYPHSTASQLTSNTSQSDTTDDLENSASVETLDHEDFSWLWNWAGKDQLSLLNLVDANIPSAIRQRALDCLDILYTINPQHITSAILEHRRIIPPLIVQSPHSSITRSLLADPSFALHPLVKDYFPGTHPLYPLLHAASSDNHKKAWELLHLGRGVLLLIQSNGCTEIDLLRVEKGEEKSNLSRLIEAAEYHSTDSNNESLKCLITILDILSPHPPFTDKMVNTFLANRLPRLMTVANARNLNLTKSRHLSLPNIYARTIVAALLQVSTEVVDGKLVYPFAAALAAPYLSQLDDTDPLQTAFTSMASASLPSPLYPDDDNGRRLTRLADSISSPMTAGESNSLVHSATPSELLLLIAPALVQSLATASFPPFGIKPNTEYASPDTQGASAWAGKVYSDHQFRTREIPNSNLNLGTVQSQTGMGVGLGIAGMGVGASRPASRHVDEYAR